jgi:type II secretory pathway pseudopilin PulG
MQTHREQAGYSLLEVLISIMLTSMVILGLAGSLLAAIKSSEVAERVQRADSALGSFTESLKTMDYPAPDSVTGLYDGLSECPGLSDYKDAWNSYLDAWVPSPQLGIDKLEITGVEHWYRDGTDVGTYTDVCPTTGDPYTHRLTVEVEIENKARSAQVVVVHR